MTSLIPTPLYHGSPFKNERLKPGFDYSGKEVKWDGTESNRYIYAAEEREFAIWMAITSLLEKRGDEVTGFTLTNSLLTVYVSSNDMTDIQTYLDGIISGGTVYVYEIKETQEFIKVDNKNNKGIEEYKFKGVIDKDNYKVTDVPIRIWLIATGNKIVFEYQK
jgi:hypothetical protein